MAYAHTKKVSRGGDFDEDCNMHLHKTMGYAPKTHFKKTVQKLLAFTMANTNPKHPCMNHGKCKLKKTAFTMGNANSRFFVFTMVNAHFKMHLPW